LHATSNAIKAKVKQKKKEIRIFFIFIRPSNKTTITDYVFLPPPFQKILLEKNPGKRQHHDNQGCGAAESNQHAESF
jgi:16S rRNA G966 N2-methylase RsmD